MSQTNRSVEIDLGDGEATIAVTVRGCDCALEDFQMALVRFARDWKKERAVRTSAPVKPAPCGCKEKR